MPGGFTEEIKAEPAWPSIRPAGYLGASLALVSLLARAPSAHADEGSGRLAPDSVYAEAFGAGLVDTLNYERIVADRFALRAGAGMFTGRATYGTRGVDPAFFRVSPSSAVASPHASRRSQPRASPRPSPVGIALH